MRTRGPVLGPAAWLVAALLAVLVLLGSWGLRDLVLPGPWTGHAALVAVLALVTGTAVRVLTRGRVLGSVAGLVVGLLATWSLYSGTTAALALPVPTPESWRRIQLLLHAGVDAITDGAVPVDPTRGLGLLLVLGVLAVAVSADLLAGGLARPALAGLPVLALWAVPVNFARDPSPLVLLLGGVSYLLLLSVGRPRAGTASTPPWRDPATLPLAAAVTVVAVALGPVAAATGLYGSVRLPGNGPGPGTGPVSVSLDLDMRQSLTERTPRTLLTYRLTGSDPGPLRLYTMTDFDGREWLRAPETSDPVAIEDDLLWPDETPPAEGGSVELAVQVGDLEQDRLPIPLEPRRLDVGPRWGYDPGSDEVLTRTGSTRGLRYTVETADRELTAEALQALDVVPNADALVVPQTSYAGDVEALAEEIVTEAGATTPYDQALALQSWFRDGTNFRYDTRIPPARTDDAVWDFLAERSGYCVQFATAMTVMARSLELPTRIAVGFLPGRAVAGSPGEFAVTGRQAHAWPEVHFEGVGWVRFEPTPAQQTSAPPTYADPLGIQPEETAAPTPGATATGPATATPTPSRTTGASGPGTGAEGDGPLERSLVAGLAGLLLLVLAGIWLRARRNRPPEAPLDPERAWARLREAAATRGSGWSVSTTPHQAAELLLAELAARRASAGPTDDDAADEAVHAAGTAVRGLASAVSSDRYSPRPAAVPADQLERWLGDVERAWSLTQVSEGRRRTLVRSR